MSIGFLVIPKAYVILLTHNLLILGLELLPYPFLSETKLGTDINCRASFLGIKSQHAL
jgi:hypothetical protein